MMQVMTASVFEHAACACAKAISQQCLDLGSTVRSDCLVQSVGTIKQILKVMISSNSTL